MAAKELSSAVEELQQQVRELRALIEQQGAEIVELRKHRVPVPAQQHAQHLDRQQRLLAVARLSAKFPDAHSFTAAQVQAEMAEAA